MFRRHRRLWIALALVAALVIIAAALLLNFLFNPPPPLSIIELTPGSPPTGEFIFMSNRDGDWDIYLMNLSDNSVQNVTNNEIDDGFGAFSEDGGAITFLSNRIPQEGLSAFMMNADGSNVSRVQNDLPTILNVLSTGRMIWDVTPQLARPPVSALVSLRDLNLEVYLRRQLDEGEITEENLSNNGAIDWFPALSPDATRIAFSSDRDGNQEIYVMNIDGSSVRRLTDQDGDDLFPAWVSSGEQIVFYSERDTTLANGTVALYSLKVDDENPTAQRLDAPLLGDGDVPLDVDNHYNNFGSRLYMTNQDGDWDIYYSDQSGERIQNLTDNDSDDLFPAWR